ncbi:4'-phosphopantetheinyl transferase family protein [Vibrio splendidus]|uniref:4-phosphopantetheinyl transferase n=1 Tax=Vibrio splendidus 12E03 TaxID=1191305 RepID=A0A1E5FUK6_VIBSP|nr:4'-phosphopantetheinyl transferase superfamily protein [Vibrio splendidus]OEF94211.1 4-phosphopantetheinyl transferase [Vibrio splendidus 12E03]
METPVVDLWLCSLSDLDKGTEHVSRLKQKLTDDEVAKVERYRMPSSQIQALYVRNYLREVLSFYSDLAAEEWRFEYGEKGKPSLIAEQQYKTGLNFNISHSQEHLLIAVCQTKGQSLQLGVDIEHARSSTNIAAIMKHYFSEFEINDLLELDELSQRERFFDLWALKESYIKATGKGLATSLKSFSFDFSNLTKQVVELGSSDAKSGLDSEIRLHSGIGLNLDSAQQDDSSTDWQCCLGRLDEQYRFAVTLGGNLLPMQIEMRTFSSSHLF